MHIHSMVTYPLDGLMHKCTMYKQMNVHPLHYVGGKLEHFYTLQKERHTVDREIFAGKIFCWFNFRVV